MHSFSNLKAMSSPLVSPLLFPRRIRYGQFVLKFTQEERECPNLIADYPARRGSARSARSATRRLEKREESNGGGNEATRYAKKRAARRGNEARSRGRDLAGTGMNAERSPVGSHAASTAPNLETRRSRERNFTRRAFARAYSRPYRFLPLSLSLYPPEDS